MSNPSLDSVFQQIDERPSTALKKPSSGFVYDVTYNGRKITLIGSLHSLNQKNISNINRSLFSLVEKSDQVFFEVLNPPAHFNKIKNSCQRAFPFPQNKKTLISNLASELAFRAGVSFQRACEFLSQKSYSSIKSANQNLLKSLTSEPSSFPLEKLYHICAKEGKAKLYPIEDFETSYRSSAQISFDIHQSSDYVQEPAPSFLEDLWMHQNEKKADEICNSLPTYHHPKWKERNQTQLAAIEKALLSGSSYEQKTFIIGFMHLFGEIGLLNELRKKGAQVSLKSLDE